MNDLRLDVVAGTAALTQLRDAVSGLRSVLKDFSAATHQVENQDLKNLAAAAQRQFRSISGASTQLKKAVSRDSAEMVGALGNLAPALERIATALERQAQRQVQASAKKSAALAAEAEAIKHVSDAEQRAAQKTKELASQTAGARQALASRGSPLLLGKAANLGARHSWSQADFERTMREGSEADLKRWRKTIGVMRQQALQAGGDLAGQNKLGAWVPSDAISRIDTLLGNLNNARRAKLQEQQRLDAEDLLARKTYRARLKAHTEEVARLASPGYGYSRERAAMDLDMNHRLGGIGKYAKKAGAELRGFGDQAHAVTRGVAAGFDNMWLSYGKYAAYTAGAFAAVAGLRKALSNAVDLDNKAHYIAALDDKRQGPNVVGDVQNELLDASARVRVSSARELADTLRALAQAGVESSQGMRLLGTTSKYATIEQMDAKKAGEDLIGTLQNFGLYSETNAALTEHNFKRTADVIAYVATSTSASLSDVNSSMKNAIGVSKAFGLSLEASAVAVELLGKANIRNGMAGTIYRNFAEDVLGKGTKQGNLLRDKLGLGAFDPSKEGPVQYIDKMVASLRRLDEKQRIAVIETLTDERGRKMLRELTHGVGTFQERLDKLSTESSGKLESFWGKFADKNASVALKEASVALDDLLTRTGKESVGSIAEMGEALRGLFRSYEEGGELARVISAIASSVADLLKSHTEARQVAQARGKAQAAAGESESPWTRISNAVVDAYGVINPKMGGVLKAWQAGRAQERASSQSGTQGGRMSSGVIPGRSVTKYDEYVSTHFGWKSAGQQAPTPLLPSAPEARKFSLLRPEENTISAQERPGKGTHNPDIDNLELARQQQRDRERAGRTELESMLRGLESRTKATGYELDMRQTLLDYRNGKDPELTEEGYAKGLQDILDARRAAADKEVVLANAMLDAFLRNPKYGDFTASENGQAQIAAARQKYEERQSEAAAKSVAAKQEREGKYAIDVAAIGGKGKQDSTKLVEELRAGTKREREAFDRRFAPGADQAEWSARAEALAKVETQMASLRAAQSTSEVGSDKHRAYQQQIDDLKRLTESQVEAAGSQARMRYEMERTAGSGALSFFQKLREETSNTASLVDGSLNAVLSNTTSYLEELATSGKASFSGFISSMLKDLARLQAQRAAMEFLGKFGDTKNSDGTTNQGWFGMAVGAVTSWYTGSSTAGSAAGSAAGSVAAEVRHTGGVAGGAGATRTVPLSLFDNAPRYHTGTLAAGEIPAVLKKGEGVFTEEQMANLAPAGRGVSQVNQVSQVFNLTIQGAQSASEARQQAAEASRELRREMKTAALEVVDEQKRSRGRLENA